VEQAHPSATADTKMYKGVSYTYNKEVNAWRCLWWFVIHWRGARGYIKVVDTRYLRGAVAIVIHGEPVRSLAPFLARWHTGVLVRGLRWSKVSPDHILNESALRSEGPLSTVVLLALSKLKESKEGGRQEKEKTRTWGAGKVAVMYLALSCPMLRHGWLSPTLHFVTASRCRVRRVRDLVR